MKSKQNMESDLELRLRMELCSSKHAPVLQAEDKKTSFVVKCLRKLRRPSTLVLVLGWLVLFGLIFYVQQYAKEMSPFDPFDILKVCTCLSRVSHVSCSIIMTCKMASFLALQCTLPYWRPIVEQAVV